MDANHRSASLAAVLLVFVVFASPVRAQSGVVLVTDTERIPLTVYAEFLNSGVLRIASGSARDIPTVDSFRLIHTSITGWHPVAGLAASGDLFTSEYAERRRLPIAMRQVGVTAFAVRIADLETAGRVADLHRQIGKPEGGEDAYFFFVLTSGGITRYYPFRLEPAIQ